MGLAHGYSSMGNESSAIQAILLYNKACLSPHPFLEYQLGRYYMHSFKDMQKAIVHFETAVQYPQLLDRYGNTCSDLYFRLGLCYLHIGEPEKAKNTWLEGLKFFPRNANIIQNLSLLNK
jgi:tetratricopeptide (TPR) repeat protein